jgi:hypothetical protein
MASMLFFTFASNILPGVKLESTPIGSESCRSLLVSHAYQRYGACRLPFVRRLHLIQRSCVKNGEHAYRTKRNQ